MPIIDEHRSPSSRVGLRAEREGIASEVGAQMPAVVIAGPTAVGKTEVGLRLAAELEGQIISVDSRQIYRHMDIGTAKPTAAELHRVRHHFIDIREPRDHYNAGQFGREARELIGSLSKEGIASILVGGSGLYLASLVDGLTEAEVQPEVRKELADRLETHGLESLYHELGIIDPVTQAGLSANDSPRVLRALELARMSPGHVGPLHACLRPPPLMFALTMERSRLYQRVDERIDAMLQRGWLAEVQGLIDRGLDKGSRGLDSLGYQELCQHLSGQLSLADAVEGIKRRTRRYAKRQLTWFRKDRRLRWLDLDKIGGAAGACSRILLQIRAGSASARWS